MSDYRRARGIEANTGPTTEERLEPYRELLGEVYDQEVAERSGVCAALVGQHRRQLGIPRCRPPTPSPRPSRLEGFEDLLGMEPDEVVAEKAGLAVETVGIYRRRMGVPAPEATPRPAPAEARVLAARDRLGRESDLALAAEVGVGATTVARVRRSLGIESYRSHHGPEAQARRATHSDKT